MGQSDVHFSHHLQKGKQMPKTAEDVQVGDVIVYESMGYDRREIKVTSVSKDIKNNRAGFDGVTVDGNEPVWGYCSQIVKFVSHAEKESN
jgi:hypothetical protein